MKFNNRKWKRSFLESIRGQIFDLTGNSRRSFEITIKKFHFKSCIKAQKDQ